MNEFFSLNVAAQYFTFKIYFTELPFKLNMDILWLSGAKLQLEVVDINKYYWSFYRDFSTVLNFPVIFYWPFFITFTAHYVILIYFMLSLEFK